MGKFMEESFKLLIGSNWREAAQHGRRDEKGNCA